MNASVALNGGKVGTSSSSPPQEKGRKNKRKLADPSQQNAASLIEFPRYELHSLKSQIHLCENGSIGQLKEEESEFIRWEWDDPFACHLEELLSSNLLTLFRSAMDQIVDYGYREDVVLKALSGSRLYCGGNNLLSNIVNDTLSFLKSGKKVYSLTDYVFEDLQQLVAYTLVEKISLVREVRPSLSIVEAMWRLLMCDLNVVQAFEGEGDGLEESSGFNPNKSSESSGAECNPPKSSDSDNPKPPISNVQSSEPVKFGNFQDLSNSKSSHASGETTGKEVFSVTTASGEGTKSTSLTSVSDEKLVSCRKSRTKKVAMLRHKSCVEKIRTYSKGSGYKKFASVGGFLLEKRVKSPSDLASVQALNSSSKITAEVGKVPLAKSNNTLLTNNNTKSDSPAVDVKGCVTTLPAINAPAPLASEKKVGSESEEKASVSTTPALDYYAAIPYDASLGIYVPQNKRDELILELVPRMKDLQNKLQGWTDWANQKVKQATIKLLKVQPELKALRKEKEEAEELRKEEQLLEENTMKRRSEMELALNNATSQLEKTNSTVVRRELEQSLLKKEREAANIRAAESAESCIEAKERVQRLLKNIQSWEGQNVLLQEELKSRRNKVAELQQEAGNAKTRQTKIEATSKQEKAVKGKLDAQAAALKKERGKLEELGKSEEERIKTKAENDVKYYIENIKRFENEIAKLKLKSDYFKIAALKKGIDGSKSGMSHTTTAKAKVWENNDRTEGKIKRERECVMCLCEEMSVIFLPCAHQVLCTNCNQLHEKEAMEDCPSCRAKIHKRIQARFSPR